jgi:hypothetical protein
MYIFILQDYLYEILIENRKQYYHFRMLFMGSMQIVKGEDVICDLVSETPGVGMILQKAFDGLRFILNIFFHSGAES